MKHLDPRGNLNRRERRAVDAATTTDAEARAVAGAMAARKRFDADAFLRRFWAMDATLVAAGFPAISPWWRAEIERFVRSGCRRWVIRAGRRAGKSTTLCRLAVAWAWFGPWHVPPGDTPVIPFISVSKDESAGRLRTIHELHQALGLPCEKRDGEITGVRGVLFKTFAATAQAVVGFTSISIFGDEVAMWESRDSAANPAAEVFGFLLPTLATQAFGFAVLSSAPWGLDDYHAQLFARGDDGHQVTSFAASWVANPTITKEQTHDLEPDERTRLRAYGAIPQASLVEALPHDAVENTKRAPPRLFWGQAFMSIDASAGASCEFAHAIAWWGRPRRIGTPIEDTNPIRDEHGNDLSEIYEVDSSTGRLARGLGGHLIARDGMAHVMSPTLYFGHQGGITGWAGSFGFDEIVGRLALKAHEFGVRVVVGDGYIAPGLESEFRRHGLRFIGVPTSNANKAAAVKRLRLLMSGKQIVIDDDGITHAQLHAFREKIDPGGTIKFSAAPGMKSDRVSVILNALIAEEVGELPAWSPTSSGKQGRGEGRTYDEAFS